MYLMSFDKMSGLNLKKNINTISAVLDIGSDKISVHKDKEKTITWDKETICNVFSVTKGIIVPCMMHLVEQGKISLDDKVSKY